MMNVFRKNKKAKEVKETLADLENGHHSSPFSLKLSKKKDAPEEELKLDFADALPSSDDFRTSLLMPKLSARFSMLREQDDPTSKMGKASDDSVLFPKRASRLNLFGHNPAMLTDIDEVSSNDGSRPSIALGRTDSYVSGGDGGYGTDDDRSHNGSIMSRARRAEGNNLFGGRQKVYRIPVRSPGGDSPTAESPRGMGKFVYEHDLNMSAFQRMRLQEKQEKAAEAAALEIATPDSEDTPSISSANRTTFSSTASGPAANARSSTAATSIDESQLGASYLQPSGSTPTSESPSDSRSPSALSINRPGSVRSRRLYGQGLTQNVQSHQNSTLNRLESLSRQRSGTPDLMNRNYTRSATNLRDRLQKLAINEPVVSRPTSPPLSATSPKQLPRLETSPKERISPTGANFGVPPLSPPTSENDDSNSLLAAALNPEDHGKATAMGLFNRPSTGFDEQQFVRRQLQLHQGRDTPPPLNPSSSPRRVISNEQPNRPRGLSKSSFRSRAESASSHYSSDAHGMEHSRASSVEASPRAPGVRTFYAASNSESGDEGEDRRSYELSSVTSMGTDYSFHRSSITPKPSTPTGEHLETLPEVRYSDLGDLKPITEDEIPEEAPDAAASFAPERPDSPTLQPAGMTLDSIRSHLRTGSDRSSIFPPPSPRMPIAVVEHKKLEPEVSVLEVQPSPTTEDHLRVDALRDSSEAETSSYRDSSRQSAEVPTSRGSQDSSNSAHSGTNVPSWQQDLSYHHRREGSTETQKEREEFAMEIAERRRKIQEKLRSVAESESRSSSPTPSQSGSEANSKYGSGFSILKHKHSKHGNKLDMYGYNSSSTPSLLPEDQTREERPALFSRHSNSSAPQISSERSFRSRMPTLSRSASRESSGSRGTSPQPGYRMQRDRSSSDASGRSKSRTRYRDRDDLETVEEGAVIAHENFVIPDNFEPPAIGSVPGSARPSIDGIECLPYDRTTSAASGRYRSASRSGTPSFQYERPFQFNQAPNPASIIGASPRPSPATPAYSANATPPLNEMPPSPTTNPASVMGHSQVPPPRAAGHHLMLQKRPVNKKLISEPTFVSCTSNVPTVGIPAGTAPPLPPMNPRRRRGTQTILSAFRPESRVSSPAPSITDEHSVFPDDEKRPRSRSRLRKKSLETGERVASPTPAVPHYPPPSVPVDGGMF